MSQKANVNVYLILLDDNHILLSLRKNTGYEDGKWSLISGHVENNESAIEGLVRETREEIGIDIKPLDLTIVHIMHRKTDRDNIDIFMSCNKWDNEIVNNEPEKCGGLRFFDPMALPENTIDFIVEALQHIPNNTVYSERGWSSNGDLGSVKKQSRSLESIPNMPIFQADSSWA